MPIPCLRVAISLLYPEMLGQALTLDSRIQGILIACWVIDPLLLTGFIPPCA